MLRLSLIRGLIADGIALGNLKECRVGFAMVEVDDLGGLLPGARVFIGAEDDEP